MKRPKKVKGSLGADWRRKYGEDARHHNLMLEAMTDPDLLSSEDQCMYPERDFEAEAKREAYLKILAASLEILTDRQKQIVFALKNSTQIDAAKLLGISQSTLATTLMRIRKKLARHVDKLIENGAGSEDN